MKTLMICIAATALLAGCATYDGYYDRYGNYHNYAYSYDHRGPYAYDRYAYRYDPYYNRYYYYGR